MTSSLEKLKEIRPNWKGSYDDLKELLLTSSSIHEMKQAMKPSADKWATLDTSQILIPIISYLWNHGLVPEDHMAATYKELRSECPSLNKNFVEQYFSGRFGGQHNSTC